MRKLQTGFALPLLLVIIAVVAVGGIYLYKNKNSKNIPAQNFPTDTPAASEQMSLTVYLQDKVVAETRDCRVTYPVTYQIPKTTAVADASLKILFEKELSKYGVYKSVSISNGVARVILQSNIMPSGYPISALSSCEIGHLTSVINDTLTQYPSIQSVEIFSPDGKIEF